MSDPEFGAAFRWVLADRWRTGVAVVLGWTLVGFLSAAHWQLFFQGGSPYTWWQLLRIKLVLWYLWGATTVLIVRLGRRHRPEGSRPLLAWCALFMYSLVVVSLYLALYTLAIWAHLKWMGADPGLSSLVRFVLDHHSTFYYLAFWATLGVDYAFVYARRLRERELLASHLQAQLSQARLHELQSRLQPHFLFNALNTIASMVHDRRSDDAYDVLARLAELLRESLKENSVQTIQLSRELELVSHYLEIVRARFPDRLRVHLQHDEALGSLKVPTLILQPLVENAVVHGLKADTQWLDLTLASKRLNGRLVLTVEDNGPGLPAEFNLNHSHGFGISSTRERLQNLYGTASRFSITSNGQQGTCVQIELPASDAKEEASA